MLLSATSRSSAVSPRIIRFPPAVRWRNLRNGAFAGTPWKASRVVTIDHITEYLGDRKRAGLAAASIKLIVVALKIFFRFLLGKKLVRRDPTETLSLPRIERYLPETLNEIQVEQLLEAMIQLSGWVCAIAPSSNCSTLAASAFPNWRTRGWRTSMPKTGFSG